MNTVQKIFIGAVTVIVLAAGAFFFKDGLIDSGQKQPDTPDDIVTDYRDLLVEAEELESSIGADCSDKKSANKKIAELEKKLSDLADRKKEWLDNVPELPDVEPETINTEENPLGRPGSEVPELTSDVPPLPEINPEDIVVLGSEVPELTSDVPPLPDINLESTEFIPELPEINNGRSGSEVPELTSDVPPLPEVFPEDGGVPGSEVPEINSDVPPLPEIDEMDIVDPNEPIIQMENSELKISKILQTLKNLCQEEDQPKKAISDKCSDACQRYRDCATYTEDITAADLEDVYNTCMEECTTWPKEMVKCINTMEIKKPNDCVGFLNCEMPQFYEEKYLP